MMDIECIKTELKNEEDENFGEILKETDTTVEWYDYDFSYDDHTIVFRDGSICTKDLLLSLCHITDKAKDICGERITPKVMRDILEKAYHDILPDMMATLRGVVIIKNAEDQEEAFKLVGISPSAHVDDHIGISIFDSQLCLIMVEPIMESSEEIVDSMGGRIMDEFMDGVGVTLIHETRHQMIDCNFLLSEDEYPSYLATEEQVEQFARQKWDSIRTYYIGKG